MKCEHVQLGIVNQGINRKNYKCDLCGEFVTVYNWSFY